MNWRSTPAYPDYVWQLSQLLPSALYRDPPLRPGGGEPILLIPGILAGDWTLRVLAGWLGRLGYRSYLSGIDWNVDCPNRTGELLRWRLDHILQETGQPLTLVGHSLGGMLARFRVRPIRHKSVASLPSARRSLLPSRSTRSSYLPHRSYTRSDGSVGTFHPSAAVWNVHASFNRLLLAPYRRALTSPPFSPKRTKSWPGTPVSTPKVTTLRSREDTSG